MKAEEELKNDMAIINAHKELSAAIAKGKANKYELLELGKKERVAVIAANHRGYENSKKTKGNTAALVLLDALAMPKDSRLFLACESFDEIEQWYAVFGFNDNVIPFLESYKDVCIREEWYRMAHNLSKAIEHYKKYYKL